MFKKICRNRTSVSDVCGFRFLVKQKFVGRVEVGVISITVGVVVAVVVAVVDAVTSGVGGIIVGVVEAEV